MKVKHLAASRHADIEQLFDGIWFVRGEMKMPMVMPLRISRSMTIVRGDGDELVLFNSMRLTEPGLSWLESLGKVAYVVRIAGFHGRDDGFYRDRFGAKVLAISGQRYERGLGKPAETYMEPDEWLTEDSTLPLAGARLKVFASAKPSEAVCLLDREGGILISGDSLQHTPKADEFYNLTAKVFMKKFGFLKPYNVGPGWLKYARPTAEDVGTLLEWEFEHVLPGHGKAVIGGAKDRFRPAIEGVLRG